MSITLCALLQQRVKEANTAEEIKAVAVNSSNAEFHFQQLDKLRVMYEEYAKTVKELIPLAETNLNELNEELDQKNQALDDVIVNCGIFGLNGSLLLATSGFSFSLFIALLQCLPLKLLLDD